MDRPELERLTREQLIAQAEELGIPRPRVLTRPELIDEIIGRTARSEPEKQRARGWLGRARDLLARVVERGLHLPEAARVLRSGPDERPWPAPPPPLPTVTLAEIYAAQGHVERALGVLEEVLAREPDQKEQKEARALRAQLTEQMKRSRGGRGAPASEKQEAAKQESSMNKDATSEEAKGAAIEGEGEGEGEGAAIEGEGEGAAEPAEASGAGAGASTEAGAEAETSAEAEVSAEAEAGAEEEAEASAEEAEEEAVAVEEAPLPERYDVDEIVAIAVDPRTIYLYWEVRATTLAHARAGRPEGWLGVRVVSVTASWSGPVVQIRDLHVDALYGDRFLKEVEPGSNVRVSVGWHADGDFEPFAVGIEATVPHLLPAPEVAQETAFWAPNGGAAQGRAPRSRPEPQWPLPFLAHAPSPRNAPQALMSAGAGAGHESAPPWHAPDRRPGGAGSWKAPEAAPIDTGVEVWRSAPHAVRADEVALAHLNTRFQPGGSSELGPWAS